jgi:hypothetical protein
MLLSSRYSAQHSVHPTGGSLRVFRQLLWLEAGSGKAALPRPAHQRVTPAVGRQVRESYFLNSLSRAWRIN